MVTLLGIALIVAFVLCAGLLAFGLCQASRAGDELSERALDERRKLKALDGMGEEFDAVWLHPERRPELHSIDGGRAA